MDIDNNLDELFDIDRNEVAVNDVTSNLENKNNKTEIISSSQNSNNNMELDININAVYKKLESLIDIGTESLDIAKYQMENIGDAEAISGISRLLNSVNQIVKEFNKIYLMELKHKKQLDIEKHKNEYKKELLMLKLNNDNNSNNTTDLIPYTQESMIKLLKDVK